MSLVTLHDGRQVDSMTREWQIECLARHLLTRPLEDRRQFIAGFEKRNPRAADQLRGVMTSLHRAAKAG